MAVTVTIDDIKRVYKAFEELAVEEYRELIDKIPKGKDKPFQSLLLLGDVRTAFLHIIESREDVWQEAQGRAEEVAQMFQLPEGIPDADELAAEDEIYTLGQYYYGYPEPTGKDFLYPFDGNPQLCLDEA